MKVETGYDEGSVCNRRGCQGVIEIHPSENCSCHIAPPCGSCTAPRNFCPKCGWEEADDVVENNFILNINKETGIARYFERRPLDASKIDYHILPHSHFSQICDGVYPDGTTKEQVREKVNGTFGGRFESFGGGKFSFVAYTD